MTTTPSCGERGTDPARSIHRSTSIVFAKTRTFFAPRETTDSCAAEPTTSTDVAPRITGVATASLTARRQRGLGSRSWLSTWRTYGTRCARHHATAACDANVLQPETTTTSGRARRKARAIPG